MSNAQLPITHQIVFDMYVVLYEAYEQSYQRYPDNPSWPAGGKDKIPVPVFLQYLLPQSNGYVYSPDFAAPVAIAQYSTWITGGVPRVRGGVLYYPALPKLATLQNRIVERAWTYGLTKRAGHLLADAIAEADRRVSAAEYEGHRLRPKTLPSFSSIRPSLLKPVFPSLPRFLNTDLHTTVAIYHLEKVRRHWLVLWAQADKERVAKARAAHGDIRIKEGNWEALITAKDLKAADATIQAYLIGPGSDRYLAETKVRLGTSAKDAEKLLSRNVPIEYLHAWYVETLWLCGASWQDLRRILRDPDTTPGVESPRARWTKAFYDKTRYLFES